MAQAELLQQQIAEQGPTPAGVERASNLLLPPQRSADRLRHFPEEVYDLNAESHLVRFLKVLLGDAGVGQLRKRLTLARLQQTLGGSHFYDLDRFYGALFGVRRKVAELLTGNPYSDLATSGVWDDEHRKDASYRSRIEQFARAINFGATPTGMELASEAILAADVDVYESYSQSDAGYRTYGEIESAYLTYNDMENISYGVLEGLGLPTILGNERREFVVWPKRTITLEEAYSLSRVLDRLKPADARFRIEADGIDLHAPISIVDILADSNYWEIESRVSSRAGSGDPYLVSVDTPTEQPRPPFSAYQGEAWSYVNDIALLSTYLVNELGDRLPTMTQRVSFVDGFRDYPADHAILPPRYVQAGRSVSDAILISHPYAGDRKFADYRYGQNTGLLAPLYADRIPLDDLNDALDKAPEVTAYFDSAQRFWVTPERSQGDTTQEVLELRLTSKRRVNYLTLEVSRFPHLTEVQYLGDDGQWHDMLRQVIADSNPSVLDLSPPRSEDGHPQHSLPSHWVKCSARIDAIEAQQFRIRMTRGGGVAPRYPRLLDTAPYSLAVRSLDIGYRISSRADVPDTEVIGTSRDVFGSTVQFQLREDNPRNLLTEDGGIWRSEPQPVNYGVVNLYLRMPKGITSVNGSDVPVIDRLYLDPTHPGAHMTVYWSNGHFTANQAGGDWGSVDPGTDFESFEWVPIPRDYTLQKGYVHFPPTRARFFKLEFTNLVAEPYESFIPITRKVKLFPSWLVEQTTIPEASTKQALPQGVDSAIELGQRGRYLDAITDLRSDATRNRATETYYVPDPAGAERARKEAWFFGYTPWAQGDSAPRWAKRGQHYYDEIEIRHDTKVAFFVGLNEIRAYRVQYDAQDDTPQYRETFYDTSLLGSVGTKWHVDLAAQAGAYTQLPISGFPSDIVSKSYESRHAVRGVQFATQQSDPVQIIPDDDFTNPALATSTWTDQDLWHKVGDAQLIYSPADRTVIVSRNVDPPPRAINRVGGLAQPVVKPPFLDRPFTVEDTTAIAASFGGLETPALQLTPEGRIVAAGRVTLETDLTNPLVIQILSNASGAVLAEKEITGSRGELLEWWIDYEIGTFYVAPPPPTPYQATSAVIDRPIHEPVGSGQAQPIPLPPQPPPTADDVVRVRLIQRGDSNDQFRIDRLSLFDEGILWDFSVDGGQNWLRGNSIRNNANGVIVFGTPGTSLVWRARATRVNVGVQSLQIRPWYVGRQNARVTFQHRGPNVSVFDQVPPITEDPEFTSWTKPIPRWWFWAYRGFGVLTVQGIPNVSPASRFFSRSGIENLPPVMDFAGRNQNQAASTVDYPPSVNDSGQRVLKPARRSGSDTAPVASDEGTRTAVPYKRTTTDLGFP